MSAGQPGRRHADLLAATALCAVCPRLCRDRCPVANAGGAESATPSALMERARLHLNGSAPLVGGEAAWLWRCVDCGACTERCEIGQDPPSVLRAVRRTLIDAGDAPALVSDNDPSEPACPVPASTVPATPSQSIAWFVGCRVTPDEETDALARLRAVVDQEPLRFTRSGRRDDCCGAVTPFADLWPEDARAMARQLDRDPAIATAGTIVTLRPACAEHLRRVSARPVEDLASFLQRRRPRPDHA